MFLHLPWISDLNNLHAPWVLLLISLQLRKCLFKRNLTSKVSVLKTTSTPIFIKKHKNVNFLK